MFNNETSYEVDGLTITDNTVFNGFIYIGFNDNDDFRFDIEEIGGDIITNPKGDERYMEILLHKSEKSVLFDLIEKSFIEHLKTTPYKNLQGVVDDARLERGLRIKS